MLVAAVEKATENFIEVGEQIAYENPDIKQEMLAAVEEVRKTGKLINKSFNVILPSRVVINCLLVFKVKYS